MTQRNPPNNNDSIAIIQQPIDVEKEHIIKALQTKVVLLKSGGNNVIEDNVPKSLSHR